MLSSMTGFGKQVIEQEEYQITVEMRSVNNRFLDITIKMPRSFYYLEEKLKKIIKNYFKRGKIEVYISIQGQGSIHKNVHVDWEILGQYVDRVEEIKQHYPIKGELNIEQLVNLEDIFIVEEEEMQDETLTTNLLQAVEESCRKLLEMRRAEGTFLEQDLEERLQVLEDTMNHLQHVRPKVIETYRERISKRITEHLAEYNTIDEARIMQEVAILAEKGDITEELTRLQSHINQMKNTLKEEGSVGRKLDFICQEMHREANTIGSKATAAEINGLDVILKTEIEKIKEQIQNIE